MRIDDAEYASRRDAFVAELERRGLAGAVLFDPQRVQYYTGFHFIQTERPVAFALAADGRGGMLVPRLEVEHAQANAAVAEVAHYAEYPGTTHPLDELLELLAALGIAGEVGADADGYPWVFGYRGPALSARVRVANVADAVEDQMAVKSETELELLRVACRWAGVAHRILQDATRVGVTETEVERRASAEATDRLLAELGTAWRAESPWYSGVWAGYRGQIGRGGAIPHALPGNLRFEAGDVLVTEAIAPVWGYHSELERTMVLGPPSDEQRRLHEHMVALQDLAVDALRAGSPCSEVDARVRAYYDAHALWPYWRHHSGHAIGLRYHEGPFLDVGDDTELRPGMVFTVEPGLYA
ncbi:MAG TPA: Xaa-Pro peptidase family protein, partial [Gaiellaceae bacterium]|nr:Xaa-Pro peptidase family protein [Gaiellaceae bacterium]